MSRSLCASRRVAVALVAALILAVTSVAFPDGATAASPRKCKVFNSTQGYARGNLQAAVDAAEPGDILKVRGTCRGGTVIAKDLTIIGIRKPGSGRPTLDGKFTHRVLRIDGFDSLSRLIDVRIRNLTIQNGLGGIELRESRVVLKDVEVRRNWRSGAHVNQHTSLTLRGSTVIRDNVSEWGGGVSCPDGDLILQGRSTIKRNISTGTGLYSGGGGVWADSHCVIEMRGQSSIHHNVASAGSPGGIYYLGGKGPPPSAKGVACGIGGNVHHNYPYDCD